MIKLTTNLLSTIHIDPHAVDTIATAMDGTLWIYMRSGATFAIVDHTPESLAKLITESKNATQS